METKNECIFSDPMTNKEISEFKEILSNNFIEKFNKSFEEIEKDKRLFRFYLKHKIQNSKGNKILTVIAMNPSKAKEDENDDTISNIENHLMKNHEEYSEFIIYNLFPIRIPNSEYLKLLVNESNFKTELQKNDEYIKKHINETSNDILLAWGSDYHKDAMKRPWLNDLSKKNIFVGSLNSNSSPITFSPLSYNKMDKTKKLKEVIINKKTQKLEYK